MRTYVIPTLLLVFAMLTGACAGRQVRSRTVAAPPLAVSPMPVAAETAPVPTIDVEPAPIVEAPAPSIDGDKPDSPIAVELASTDFDVQGSLDRDNAKANAEIAVEVRRMTESATRAPSPSRSVVAMRRSARTAPAVEDGGRVVAVGSLATAAPALEQTPAAPAAPSILPAPQGAKAGLSAGPAKDREARVDTPTNPAPDRDAIAQSESLQNAYLLGTAFAVIVGLLSVALFSWLQRRRLRAIAAGAYEHYEDGTIIEQKIVRGTAVIIRVTLPEPPAPQAEPVAEQKAKMDSIEQTWHAEGEAMTVAAANEPARTLHDEFDTTDEDALLERTDPQPLPVPFSEPDTIVAPEPSSPHVQPESQVAQPPAAAPPKIISSSDDVLSASGVAVATYPPPVEPRSEPEHEGAKVIILFEDKSSKNDQAEQSAAPAITH